MKLRSPERLFGLDEEIDRRLINILAWWMRLCTYISFPITDCFYSEHGDILDELL